ncbi:MAG: gliding motility-associated C-terminal domain-containing protein [Bacteroidetes bacterium]|nr:gliding motility-associated C-terminal domain-containing protein [Bacteroidota bacterium]
MLKKIFFFLIIFFSVSQLSATHLLGGIMTYRYVGRTGLNQQFAIYEITITVYRDCLNGQAEYDDPLDLGVYDENKTREQTIQLRLLQKTIVNPPNGGVNCNFSANVCIEEGIYKKQISVLADQGHHFWYQRCCRNSQNNLSDDYGQSYYCYIPAATQNKDNSPIINGVPAPYVCVGDTVTYSNAATDADGDSLVYSLEQPWTGGDKNQPKPTPPYNIVLPLDIAGYKPGYSFNSPFGAGGILTINTQTGLTTLLAPKIGQYSFAVVVKQYRKINGVWVYLSEIRRDLQLIAIKCTPNIKPAVSVSGTADGKGGYSYTVEAGDKLCFNITYIDPDYNINPNGQKLMSLSYFGDLINGTNGYVGPLATITKLASNSANIIYQFCWQTTCIPKSLERNYPYPFTITVSDSGCPPKSVSNDFNIYVTPYISNVSIQGFRTPCEKKLYTYTATSKKGVKFNWIISGPGTIQSGQGTNTIQVLWTGPGPASITVSDVTAFGCQGAPFSYPVMISSTPVINYSIIGDSVICENTIANYTLSSTPAATFSWTIIGGTQQTGGNSSTISVKWGTAGDAFIKHVEISNNGCESDTLFYKVRIVKTVIDTIMGPRSVCPFITFVNYKTTTIANASYQWYITGGTQSGGGNSSQITINWGDVGVGKIKVVATSKEGCVSDTVYASVIINHVILGFTPIGDSVVCEFEQNKVYEVVYTRRSIYSWFVTGGTNMNAGSTAPQISVNWGSAGVGTVTCIETSFDSVNNLPCNGLPATLKVRISPTPVADKIMGEKFVCQSNDTNYYSLNGYANSKYIWWKVNDTSGINGQGGNKVKFIWNSPGVFKISVQEISKDSCVGNRIDTFITVHPRPVTSPISGNAVLCFPNNLNIPYRVTGFSNSKYYWTVMNGEIVSGDNTNAVFITWNDDHNCKLQVVEESEFGCTGDTQYLDVFVDHPLIVIKSVGDEYNNEKNIILQWKLLNAPRYNSNFEIWRRTAFSNNSFGYVDSVAKKDSVYVHKYQNTNETAYEYLVKIKNLCGDLIFAPEHRNILLTGRKANDDNYAVELNWNKYFGWNGVKRYELYRRLGEHGAYQLYDLYNDTSAAYKNGFDSYYQCYRIKAIENVGGFDQESWSNEFCFGFDPIVWIPNAFTPDGNDLNDFYEVFTASIKEFHIQIYDRWGEKLFESNDPKVSWDGTSKGKTCQMDAYIYMVEYKGFDNKRIIKNGTLTLLR